MSYAELARVVGALRYKQWVFRLHQGPTSAASSCHAPVPAARTAGSGVAVLWREPLLLVVCAWVEDSLRPGVMITVEHTFAVPPEGWPGPWHRFVLDCTHQVEVHEMCEAFAVGGQRPFYPEHGPGAALYRITDRGLEPGFA